MATAGLAKMLLAIDSISSSRNSIGTTRFTKPRSSAVAASIKSPVNSISMACLREMLRESATDGVAQNKP